MANTTRNVSSVKSRIQMFQQQEDNSESLPSFVANNKSNKIPFGSTNGQHTLNKSNSINSFNSTINPQKFSAPAPLAVNNHNFHNHVNMTSATRYEHQLYSKTSMTLSLSRSTSSSTSDSESITSGGQNSPGERNGRTSANGIHHNGNGSLNGSGQRTNANSAASNPRPTPPPTPGQKPMLRRTSSIPKLVSPVSSTISPFLTMKQNSSSNLKAGMRTPTTPVSTSRPPPSKSSGTGSAGLTLAFSHPTRAHVYDSISWKEKYEESEKRRLQVVTLAQKATRDYEELRRRYNESNNEREKLNQKLHQSNSQLESLRKASEATYEQYHKLKKKYELENSSKSEALVRVDQYNKENRRLKRQSQVLMQQINDSSIRLEDLIEQSEADNGEETDKEILFLRSRIQELETKLVDVESELEKAKLAEFETQESVMLINDDAQTLKSENSQLRQRLNNYENETSQLQADKDQLRNELESLRETQELEKQKLQLAEAELRKMQAEKNVLQRQSQVLLSSAPLDSQLLETLNTLSELQFSYEEQRYNYEAQMQELQNHLNAKTCEFETKAIESESKIKVLEEQIIGLQKKLGEMESGVKSSNGMAMAAPPPPPPPPMPLGASGPPPPPMPSSTLGSSLQSATLRRVRNTNESNSSNNSPPNEKSLGVDASPQIDELVSQIKRGIKLKPMDRTLTRKPTDLSEPHGNGKCNGSGGEDAAVEEMKSILNNLKRTKRTLC